jgi:formate-dependent nitrite reductase cytochrome c552 subunit
LQPVRQQGEHCTFAGTTTFFLTAAKTGQTSKGLESSCKNLQRKLQHAKTHKKKYLVELSELKLFLHSTHQASQQITELTFVMEHFAVKCCQEAAKAKETMEPLQKQIRSLRQQVRQSIWTIARRVKHTKKKSSIFQMTHKGMYTSKARKLVRLMAGGGCAPEKIGPLLECISKIFGIHVTRSISQRTARRAVLKGCVAAKMQLVHEMSANQDVFH